MYVQEKTVGPGFSTVCDFRPPLGVAVEHSEQPSE